jgi:hypothetical protein
MSAGLPKDGVIICRSVERIFAPSGGVCRGRREICFGGPVFFFLRTGGTNG